ncbi:MAG TPA: hypothetical protein VFH58_12035 [Acidimicrobiales bacterium]|nr:hypothetical protein [Acidimicrobiales bacterium]
MARAFGVRTAAAILVVAAAVLAFSPPAHAIQTTTWGIQPAPTSSGPRPSLSYPSNGQTAHDAVIVYNRTDQSQVVTLTVLGATGRDGTYQYSKQRNGLAAGVTVAAERIPLPPHEQARVPVTVKLPRHSKVTTLAAIAAEGAPIKQGSLFIQQRLVLLVKATPSTASPVVPDLGLWGPAAAVLLAMVAGLGLREARRRRRTPPAVVLAPSAAQQVAAPTAGAR